MSWWMLMTPDVHHHHMWQERQNSNGAPAQARSKDKSLPMTLTKAQWMTKFKDNGMSVPPTWTVLQMKARWAELQMDYHGDINPEMEQLLKDLKRTAGKKRSDLVAMAHSEGIEVSKTATMAQLYGVIEKEFRERFEPVGSEEVGFGRHGEMTYRQICEEKKDYVEWCQKTVVESDSPGWRMERLVRYAQGFERQKGRATDHGYSSTMKPDYVPKAKAKSSPRKTMETEDRQLDKIHAELLRLSEENKALQLRVTELQEEKNDALLEAQRHKDRREM